MSNYTLAVNWSGKDALSDSDAAKVISGSDFNTEFTTIKWLSEEASRQNKVHRIIIMIELGDLREGILGEHLLAFYKKVFDFQKIYLPF